jgi:hypothetical protein
MTSSPDGAALPAPEPAAAEKFISPGAHMEQRGPTRKCYYRP